MPQKSEKQLLTEIINLIHEKFNLTELNNLCLSLGGEFEDFSQNNKLAYVQQLVTYFKRRDKIDELLKYCSKERPNVNWPKWPNLAQLYLHLKAAIADEDWERALDLCDQIDHLIPNYEDVALLRKRAKTAQLYLRLKAAIADKDWERALDLCDQIDHLVPNYEDVTLLKKRARQGQRRDQLYELGQRLHHPSTWSFVLIALLILCMGSLVILTQLMRNDTLISGIKIIDPKATSTPTPTATPTPSKTTTPKDTPTSTPTPTLPSTWIDEMGITMSLVLSGTFTMGADPNLELERCEALYPGGGCQLSHYQNEAPIHTVILPDYYIDIYEVTNASYTRCVLANECSPPYEVTSNSRVEYYGNPQYDDYPVVHVDWNQAQTYCEWRGARLPTEAEWEKAARGTEDGFRYPWGNQEPKKLLLNFIEGIGDTQPVGSYPQGISPYGVYDMAGNVSEWVSDTYGDYSSELQTNPLGPTFGTRKVFRGGGWQSTGEQVRTTWRNPGEADPDNPGYYFDLGFRCASTP